MLKKCATVVPIIVASYCVDRYCPIYKYRIKETQMHWFSPYDKKNDEIKKDNIATYLKKPVKINDVTGNKVTYYDIFDEWKLFFLPCNNNKEKCLSKNDIYTISEQIKMYNEKKTTEKQTKYILKYGKLLNDTMCREKDDNNNHKMYDVIQRKIVPTLHDHMKLCSNMHFIDENLITIIDKMIKPHIKINRYKSKIYKYPIIEIDEEKSYEYSWTIHHITGYRNPEPHYEISFHIVIDKGELQKLINYIPKNHLENIIKDYALKYREQADAPIWKKYVPIDIINNYGIAKDNIIELNSIVDISSYKINDYTSCHKDKDCSDP
jgi:hypothetical protein